MTGKKLLLNLLGFVLCIYSNAQNTIGIPEIVNYSKQEYNAGSQNWGIAQDKNGIVYFANNQGLLSFDGTFWRKYQLPNKTIVRSVAIDSNGRIYVGGQSEFGYFFPSKNGDLAYVSLMPLLSEHAKDFSRDAKIRSNRRRQWLRHVYHRHLRYTLEQRSSQPGVC